MATTITSTSTADDQTKSIVDASLWWDSFSLLLTELENASPSSDLPPHLVKKLKDNHTWFLDTVSRFKPPNEKSREALNSRQVNMGSHKLTVQPELKDVALKISSILCLDEVQAYIIVKRSIERTTLVIDHLTDELLHLVMLQYYIERQCLLKCTRQIVMHALYVGTSKEGMAVMEEAQKLISDGLESRLQSVLEDLLSASPPENMDVDLFTLWAEETLIEDNLVLDILFLAYYECHCRCTGKQWKKLCLLYEGMISGSSNFGRLAMSTEALQSMYHAKVQLLLILIVTLDLENLLQMVHDEMPFSQGSTAFSLSDIPELDATISSFSAFEAKETGPLMLSWAVFLCLVSSLPGKEENNVLMDIDHVGYVRQAFEVSSLSYFLEILQSDILKDTDGPTAGYRSVLRTFIAAFIASYEISLQLEDNTLKLILDIICKIYRGEESLCIQFWDKDSFIDGPIRCLLCNLEGEFPFRTVELVRLLSSLCEGTWPAECVYNFLDKSVGISSVFEISNGSLINKVSQIVETSLPLSIPGVEGLLIPSNTRGRILKVIDGNAALIRWEYPQSGVLVLLLRLAQELYLDSTEEVLVTLDLLSRLVSFNMAICYGFLATGNSQQIQGAGMNGHLEMHMCINVVDLMCTLVKKSSPNSSGAVMMSMGVNILAKMLKCSPSRIAAVALNSNIFDVALKMNPFNVRSNWLSSGSWLLSGRLANMLLIDCEHNDNCCQLTLSVLDFTMQLVQTGVENDFVLALVVFSFQYVLVNHEYWKYKLKHARWKVTLKVLEVMEKCILSIPYRPILGEVVRDILFCDSSVHSAIFRVVCTTAQALEKLYVSRLYDPMEIEGLQLAICSVLDILSSMLSDLSKNVLPSLPVFQQAVLSSANKPIPVVTAMISLLSYFRNPKIQMGAAKVLSVLFVLADSTQPYVFGNAWFGLDEKQMMHLKHSLNRILCELSLSDEDLFVATCKLLTSAAYYQPAFLVAVIAAKENIDVQSSSTTGLKSSNEITSGSLESAEANLFVAVLQYIMQSDDLINSKPRILLNMLNFLKALWQAAAQFTSVLDLIRNSENFWRHLSSCICKNSTSSTEVNLSENLTEMEVLSIAYRIQCQSAVLQILAFEMFLQKKLFHAEFAVKQTTESSEDRVRQADNEKSNDAGLLGLKDVLSSFHEGLVLGKMIKSYASWEYDSDRYLRAKIAAALFSVHVMGKLKNGDNGSLSVAVIEKSRILLKKLSGLPAFSELVAQYMHRGHSEGKDMDGLIISDLYYHLQAELEGRLIDPGPFKDLSQYLLESNIVQSYRHKYDGDLFAHAKDVYLFDTLRLREELGFNLWDYSDWKASKAVAETMFLCLQDVNYMVLLTSSKLSALKSLMTVLSMKGEDSSEKTAIGRDIPQQQIHLFIDQVCQCLQSTIESLVPFPDISEDVLDFTATQAELLLLLIRYVRKNLPLPVCILVLKTSGSVLKVLNDLRPLVSGVKDTMKILLMVLLSSVQSSCKSSQSGGAVEMECVEAFPDVSNVSLGLLPLLCQCTEPTDHCTVSLAVIDLVLKGFLTPNTWFPILKKHLRLQHLVLKLQDRNLISSVPIILKFLLSLARVRDGAVMLFTTGFLSSLKMLLSDFAVGNSSSVVEIERSNVIQPEKIEKPQDIWGLGLAVVTAMIHSLGDSSSGADIVDYVIAYFIVEKGYLISHYLNAPEFPSDDRDNKRARSQKTPTSLNALRGTEHTLMLLCELVKHQSSWMKAMKEMDSQLRERSIHLLAFISRGTQNFRVAPLVCHPVLKEELKWYNEPSVINSRCGWFAPSTIDCGLNPRFSAASSKSTALVVKDQGSQVTDPACQTYFSDTIAIQIYRIAFLILKFLCLQAECAIRRAEEVGFVDLAHFPELPMPEILHGLQDQGIAIVTELCDTNKMKQVSAQIQGVCILLLHMTEMALYLEYCVSQICGIRPVLGHVEDFCKGIKSLMKATEGHAFLKASVKSLKHVVSFLYPGLLQTEGLL